MGVNAVSPFVLPAQFAHRIQNFDFIRIRQISEGISHDAAVAVALETRFRFAHGGQIHPGFSRLRKRALKQVADPARFAEIRHAEGVGHEERIAVRRVRVAVAHEVIAPGGGIESDIRVVEVVRSAGERGKAPVRDLRGAEPFRLGHIGQVPCFRHRVRSGAADCVKQEHRALTVYGQQCRLTDAPMGFVAVVRDEGLVHADPAGHQIIGKSQPDFVVDVGGVARVRHQVLVVCAAIAECSLDDGGVAAVKGVEVAERGGEHQCFFRPAVSAFGVHGALSAINMILNDAAYLVGTVIDVTRAVLFLYDGRTVVERMFQRFVEGEVVARTLFRLVGGAAARCRQKEEKGSDQRDQFFQRSVLPQCSFDGEKMDARAVDPCLVFGVFLRDARGERDGNFFARNLCACVGDERRGVDAGVPARDEFVHDRADGRPARRLRVERFERDFGDLDFGRFLRVLRGIGETVLDDEDFIRFRVVCEIGIRHDSPLVAVQGKSLVRDGDAARYGGMIEVGEICLYEPGFGHGRGGVGIKEQDVAFSVEVDEAGIADPGGVAVRLVIIGEEGGVSHLLPVFQVGRDGEPYGKTLFRGGGGKEISVCPRKNS